MVLSIFSIFHPVDRWTIFGRNTLATNYILYLFSDNLTQVLEAERESPREFQALPFHYVEISRLLFDQYVLLAIAFLISLCAPLQYLELRITLLVQCTWWHPRHIYGEQAKMLHGILFSFNYLILICLHVGEIFDWGYQRCTFSQGWNWLRDNIWSNTCC